MEHKLKLVSMTDDMTGLYNRRGFRLLAEKLLLQAERNNNRLLLLYCDLDNLKVINDRFGHREGDQVIMDFVDILKNTFRKADIIARLGGDEFTVLVTGVKNLWSEQVIIKNLKEKISGHNEQERRSHPLEVSIGASYFNPVHPCTIDEFINRADNAMYKEKKKK